MKNVKKDQYELQLKNEVNNLLRTGMDNQALQFVSVTKVEISSDYSFATLFWDTFDQNRRGDIKIAMDKSLGKIRSHLAQTLNVRHIPSLSAKYDSQYDDEQVINNILDSEKKEGKGF